MIIDHMKPHSNFGSIYAGIIVGTVLAAIAIIATSHQAPPVPAQRSDQPIHSAPPPGYAIQTNGQGQWRWFRTQHGDRDSWAPMDSRQDAVDSAWLQYNYDSDQQEHPWRLESPPADPNASLIQPVEPMPMIDNRNMYEPDPKLTLKLLSGRGHP